METTNQPEMEMTPEQLEEQKEKMLEFYRNSMPYLKAQLEYEQMLLSIDETRFKRSSIQYQYAMMINPQQQEEEADEERGSDFDIDKESNTADQGKRKLKRG